MEESGVEGGQRRTIVKRQKTNGTVGRSNAPSGMARVAGKVVPAALIAVGAIAGGRAITHDVGWAMGGESDDNNLSLSIPPSEEHATESQKPQKTGEKTQDSPELFGTFFHDLDPSQKAYAQAEVEKYKNRILAKQGYQKEHLAIPLQYEDVIYHTADAYGISKDALMGLIGTENGGGTDITNGSSGARGVAQLMPETARQYGLTVNDKVDQRTDPVLSIEAAGRYLRDQKALLGGDEGLTFWAYHAGIGNVYEALRIYFSDVNGENLGNYGQAVMGDDPVAREYIESRTNELIAQDKLDVEKLFSNKKVQEFLSTLQDYSESYPFTVVAISKLINEYKAQNGLQGGGLEGRVANLGGGLTVAVSNIPGQPK